MTIPSWANSACEQFFKTGTIAGATRNPLPVEVSDVLRQQNAEAFDAFSKNDDGPDDLARPLAGLIRSVSPDGQKTEVAFRGNESEGEFTQVYQEFPDDTQHGVMVAKVVCNAKEKRIFNAALEGSDTIFMGQVINLENPELSYNIATQNI